MKISEFMNFKILKNFMNFIKFHQFINFMNLIPSLFPEK